jgi:hypothetical protein
MADYTLPDILHKLGTFSITVTSTVAALSVPDNNTVVELGGLPERLDLIPGTLDIPQMTLTVRDIDDFWSDALAGTVSVLILLDEGLGDTFCFRGQVVPAATKENELYNDGSTVLREIKITLKSYATLLENVVIADLITTLISNRVAGSTPTGYYMRIIDVINYAIASAYGQAFDDGAAFLQFMNKDISPGADIMYTDTGTNSHNFEDLYFLMQDGTTSVGYVSSSSGVYWGDMYANGWELIKSICQTFALVPQYAYDVATGQNQIRLLQRGRAYASAFKVSLGAASESVYAPGYGQALTSADVYLQSSSSAGWYFDKGKYAEGASPQQLNPQLTVRLLWDIESANLWERLFYISSGDALYINAITAYHYSNTTGTVYNSGTNIFQNALLHYMCERYYGTGQKTYYRTYPNMRANGSHAEVNLMNEIDIGGVTYTVTEYEKSWMNGSIDLTLVKI